ncbi:MAG: hypothetical protein HKN41_09135 [Ilumatobacter sp.]|nr:hypothetical protein [Ilumatobacter sp.]
MDQSLVPSSPAPAPGTPGFVDEKAVRDELTRQFSVCVGCRRCVDHCASFPALFDLVDGIVDGGPGRLTPHQQDVVVDACHQCNLCAVGCPYTADRSELAVDVPRLMLRAKAMRRAAGQQPLRQRLAVAVAEPPIPRALTASGPGTAVRRAVAAVAGVSAVRLLPPRARERFTTWFHARTDAPPEPVAGHVTIVPTCHVEHHLPDVGRDLVSLYEELGIGCALGDVVCCGAPQLHSGDLAAFTKTAERNVARLANDIRDGARAVVVPQPTCAHVLAVDTPQVVGGSDAELVAERVRDAGEWLEELAAAGEIELHTAPGADRPARIVLHASCHARARHDELPVERLLTRLGVDVVTVAGCSGTVDTWGLRSEHETAALGMATALADAIAGASTAGDSPADTVVGECLPANVALTEQTGTEPLHPIQLLRRILRGR